MKACWKNLPESHCSRTSSPSSPSSRSSSSLSRPRSGRGFTLIELLVVIAIIGVLVALIMPAVQMARESANRSKCINNLKQLGLAAQQYHDVNNSFPAGWYCDEENNPDCKIQGPAAYMWNGLVGLLPNLEQGNLYRGINIDLTITDVANVTSVGITVNAFLCPSNPRIEPISIKDANSNRRVKMTPMDYRGNMAAGRDPACDPKDDRVECQNLSNGVHYMNSEVDIPSISDGTTNTLQFGECIQGAWAEAASCCMRTLATRTMNRPFARVNNRDVYYWSSKHPGVANFTRCDGSVQSIKETINKNVFVQLMTRNGGETIDQKAVN